MKSARQTAFEILQKIQRDNSYSNLALDTFLDKSELGSKDKSFTAAIVYGVIERLITLDYNLSLYLSQPLKKLKPQVLTILRMGAFQLLFMDKVPSSAAINESVILTKKNQAAFASGLVNAVLHKIDRIKLALPNTQEKNYLSVKYSCPQWLCDMWINSYGKDNAVSLLETSLGSVETVVRVNTLKTDSDSLIKLLANENVEAQKCDNIENALVIKTQGPIYKSVCYEKGLFHVQDIASQLCCKALNPQINDVVVDVCSAPGGKSFTIAQLMNNLGKIYSYDIYEQRIKLIKDGTKRLGIINIDAQVNDASVFNSELPMADKILCDVPCSGLGVIRKKPEIRYKSMAEVDKLPSLQYDILCISVKYLRQGGIIVYSTCSLNPKENEKIIERFLLEHPDFESVRVLPEIQRIGENTDYLSLMPHIHHCDGFFISALRKN